MSAVAAPPPPVGTAAQPALPGGTIGTLVSPPGSLAELEAGTLLRGLVSAQGARGLIVISTALGELEIASRLALAPRTPVLIQLGGPVGTVTILPEDEAFQAARGPAVPVTPNPADKPAPSPAPTQTHSAPPRDAIVRQEAIPALVLSGSEPARAAEGPARAEVPLAPGTRLAVRIVAILPTRENPPVPRAANPASTSIVRASREGVPRAAPQGAAAPSGAEIGAGARQPSPPPASSGPTTQAAAGRAAAPSGPPAAGSPSALAPAAGPAPSPAPVPTRAEGKVSGVTSDGRAIISWSFGTMILERQASLTPGLRVLFDLILPSPAKAGAGTPSAAPPILTNGAGWPALSQALEVLGEGAVPAATGAAGLGGSIAESVPSPGARLGSSLLFVLSALSGGSLAAWLGDAALERLERLGRGDLTQRLTQDFGQMSRLADTQPDEWRLFPLPILHEGQVTPVHLHLRRDTGAGNDEETDDQSTRFLVELSLSRLGELQLDGLVQGKRFDLILRSRRPLPSRLRGDIAAIFEEANAITGAKGQIAFRSTDDWAFLAPRAQHREPGPSLLI